MLFALGLGDHIVGVSHECDYPAAARLKPRVIDTDVDSDRLSSQAIDTLVRERLREGRSLYRLNLELLRELQPDVVVTQELCQVCAIDTGQVLRLLHELPGRPTILSLHAHTIGETLDEIRLMGQTVGCSDQAEALVRTLQQRLARVQESVTGAIRPRVFCLEWLQPLMASGHWVPEMVELAGGVEVLGRPGQPSRCVEWVDVLAAKPEILLLMPCGFPIERTMEEMGLLTTRRGWEELPAVRQGRVYVVDGPSYFNQAGPRLVDGVELLAGLLHPDRWPEPPPCGAVARWPIRRQGCGGETA